MTANDYAAAEPDLLAEAAGEMIDHVNGDYVDTKFLLIQHHLDIKADDARMTAHDRYGFNFRMKIESKSQTHRWKFAKRCWRWRPNAEVAGVATLREPPCHYFTG